MWNHNITSTNRSVPQQSAEATPKNEDVQYYVVGTDVPCVAEAEYSKEAIDLGGTQLIRKMFSDINNYSEI